MLAKRIGSGPEDLTVALLTSDGTELPLGNAGATETATKNAAASNVDIPAGAKEIVLKLTAQQSPSITSSFYLCGVHFYAS